MAPWLVLRHAVWVCLLALLPSAYAQAQLYGISGASGFDLGAFDTNVMADDVQLRAPARLSRIELPLCIASNQNCTLWIFTELNATPLLSIPFVNTPSSYRGQFVTHEFLLKSDVPREFYIGFSAQGEGWTDDNSDFVATGPALTAGVAGTFNEFYYGAVSGGQLTSSFTPADELGHMIVRLYGTYRQPELNAMVRTNGVLALEVSNLVEDELYSVEQTFSDQLSSWSGVTNFSASTADRMWIQDLPLNTNTAFLRVRYR